MSAGSPTQALPDAQAPAFLGGSAPGPPPDAERQEVAGIGGEIPKWTEEERRSFLIGLHIVNLPGEESVLRFLCDAIKAAPLPAPWVMARDGEGRAFFANLSTEATSWNHPLEHAVRELAGAFRVCQTLAPARRKSCVATLHKTWDQEARQEFAKWYSVKHESGRAYYCHRETGEAMWEHPSEVVLPSHYLKIKAIDWLLDEQYFASICAQSPLQTLNLDSEAPAAAPLSPQSGMDAIRGELAEQLRQTIDTQRALQEELSSAEVELRTEKAAHSETKQRALEAETELAEERQHIQQCRAECAELSRERLQALELARSSEQAKDALEARLATMDAGVAKSYLKRLAKQSQAATDLNASLNASIRTLDLATESTPSRIPDLTSELEPPGSSLPSSRGEAGSLADVQVHAPRERKESIVETGGSESSGPVGDERRHFEQALAECAELSRSRDGALESAQAALNATASLEAKLTAMERTVQDRELAMAAQADDLASLQAALIREQRSRAELERTHRDAEARRLDLEEQMEQAATSTKELREQLLRAEGDRSQEQVPTPRKEDGPLEGLRGRFKNALMGANSVPAFERGTRPDWTLPQQRLEQRRLPPEGEFADIERLMVLPAQAGADRDQALERMEEAERARACLEAKLASAEELLRTKEATRSQESSDLVATLRAELVEEQAFRARFERAQGEGGKQPPHSEGHRAHGSAPPGRRQPRARGPGIEGELRGARHDGGKAPLPLAVRLLLKLQGLDWQRLALQPPLQAKLRESLRGAIAAAAGSKIPPELVELSLPPAAEACTALVLPPGGVSASNVQARLKAPELFQVVVSLLADMPELSEVSDGGVSLAEVCISLTEQPPALARGRAKGGGGGALRDAVACSDGRSQRGERQARRARRALEDAIVLASRIQLLRAEGLRTKKRIRTAQEKKQAIIIASHCAQQFAWPSASRPATAPAPLCSAVDVKTPLPPPPPPAEVEGAAADEQGMMVALALHARLAATKQSLLESNAVLKTSLALTATSVASERPARSRLCSASRPATAPPMQAPTIDPHEAEVVSAVQARLAASKAQMGRLNGALRAEVEELRQSLASLNRQRSALKDGVATATAGT